MSASGGRPGRLRLILETNVFRYVRQRREAWEAENNIGNKGFRYVLLRVDSRTMLEQSGTAWEAEKKYGSEDIPTICKDW